MFSWWWYLASSCNSDKSCARGFTLARNGGVVVAGEISGILGLWVTTTLCVSLATAASLQRETPTSFQSLWFLSSTYSCYSTRLYLIKVNVNNELVVFLFILSNNILAVETVFITKIYYLDYCKNLLIFYRQFSQ